VLHTPISYRLGYTILAWKCAVALPCLGRDGRRGLPDPPHRILKGLNYRHDCRQDVLGGDAPVGAQRPDLPPVLKLPRTVADLAGSERMEVPHLAEALQYRRRQRE